MFKKPPTPKAKKLEPLPTLDVYPVGATVQLDTTAPPAYAGQQVTIRAYSPDERQFLAELYPGRDRYLPVGYIWGYVKLPEQPIAPQERKIMLYVPATPEADRRPTAPYPKPLPAPIREIEPDPPEPKSNPKPVRMTPAEIQSIPEPPPPPPAEAEPVDVVPIVQEIREDPVMPTQETSLPNLEGLDPITYIERVRDHMETHQLNAATMARQLKVTSQFIYDQKSLLKLPDDLREAVRQGELTTYKAKTIAKSREFTESVPAERDIPVAEPAAPPPPPPVEPAPLPPAALATIPEPTAPLARADEVEALYRMAQSLKGEINALVDNLVDTGNVLPPAPLAPPVQPAAAPTSIVINITVQTGGTVTIQQ